MQIKKWIRFIIFSLVLILATSSFAYADSSAYVSVSSMKIYSDSGSSKKIGSLPRNTVVKVSSHSDGMAKIKYKGKNGYASVSDLTSISENSEKATVNTSTRLYKKASAKSNWSSLKKGTSVNLLSTSGTWSMIEHGGKIGYTKAGHLTKGGESNDSATAESAASTENNTAKASYTVKTFTAKVTANSLSVYKNDSSSSKKIGTLKKGASVNVRAYNGTWARVENKGALGYCLLSGISRMDTTDETVVPENTINLAASNSSGSSPGSSPSTQTLEQMIADGKYSNEQIIFTFLTQNMKLNVAAACGILSNIRKESAFSPTAYSSDGSYGICQWTGSRYTRLKTYCSQNNYDHSTLAGQLFYLKYELENHYTATLSYIRNVENSASGAYAAGYYWCYYFEVPANRASVSVTRGNYAKDTYWPKYCS